MERIYWRKLNNNNITTAIFFWKIIYYIISPLYMSCQGDFCVWLLLYLHINFVYVLFKLEIKTVPHFWINILNLE